MMTLTSIYSYHININIISTAFVMLLGFWRLVARRTNADITKSTTKLTTTTKRTTVIRRLTIQSQKRLLHTYRRIFALINFALSRRVSFLRNARLKLLVIKQQLRISRQNKQQKHLRIQNGPKNLPQRWRTCRIRWRHSRSSSALRLSPLRNAFLVYFALFSLKCAVLICDAFSIRDVIRVSGKRTTAFDIVICPTWHPFQCPNGECIPIKYLCDGSPDCSDEYDEDRRMCTAAIRPPVEETAAFLNALLNAHGADFLTKLFGVKAKNAMRAMGGVERVAVAISQSPTIETFGSEMGLRPTEVAQLAALLDAIVAGETSELTPDEAGDFRFFVQKLQETGFF